MVRHAWDVSISEATEIQKNLQSSVRTEPLLVNVQTIAGADISFSRGSDVFSACFAVLSYPDLIEVDRSFFQMRVTFPYVPGYLSFREVPALAEAYKKLSIKPDLIMMDGQGIAHPRRLGVATHLGLVLDMPTIGCAKSLLYGVGAEPADEHGSIEYLHDKKDDTIIGARVRTKVRCKPLIISAGHKITLEESISFVLTTLRGYRIPEPTRRTHNLVNQFRRGEIAA